MTPSETAKKPTLLQKCHNKLARLGPYEPIAILYLIGLPLLSISRALLMLWQFDRVAATGIWPQMLLQGMRADTIQLGLLSLPLLLLLPIAGFQSGWKLWRRMGYFWVILSLTLLVFLEAATPGFIAEYDSRPNRIFVEYLKYPNEVFTMLWTGFKIHLFAGIAATALTVFSLSRLLRPALAQERPQKNLRFLVAWPVIVFLCLLSIRSSLDHRPANPALFALSSDSMVNSLILNSTWSVTHAIYGLRHENRSSEIYGAMEKDDIIEQWKLTRSMLHDQRTLLNSEDIPTLVEQKATMRRKKPLNLVIILEESLGATFVESLGGVPVTPELEKLKSQGWWFEQLYATGTRSVRGIEAVTTGFLPTPAQAIVKLTLAQSNFAGLAEILGKQGYESEFIYGGESHFDNMRGFFLSNGFSKVTDQNDYKNPVFKGSWGVSDEDLLNKTHERLQEKHKEGKQSFTLVFTSSNHAPIEFPDGRISLYDKEKGTDNNAVKYTDYALGQLMKKARESDYWTDTIFLVVADHDIRVKGESTIPIERFHIPGLILGADIKPRRIKTVASQVDLPTTLLSLLGIDSQHPMVGRDLTQEPEGLAGRAMMQYEQNYGWMEGQNVVILRSEKPVAHGIYHPDTKHLEMTDSPAKDTGIEKRALAHVLLPSWLYREQRYKLPAD